MAEHDEWGDLDARLERKKRIKLRRQQREMKKQQREQDAREAERRRLRARCEEMAREDALSVAMMRLYRRQERERRRALQRDRDMDVYASTAQVRRRAQQLGLPVETPGASGVERLEQLRGRVETREAAMEASAQAKQRLDALSKKRGRVRKLLESFFASSTQAKLERAVSERRCEAIVELLDPKLPGKRADPSLVNHESENGLTPVLCAIYAGHLTELRRLMELGASPDFETRAGMTPLLASVLVDDVVALSILCEFRVNRTYETQTGVTPLLFASDKGRNAVLKALLRGGVSADHANTAGRTALIQAVISGHYETTKILLAYGATKSQTDASGRTALDWARHWKFGQIASLLSAPTSSKALLSMIQEQDEREIDAPNRLVQQVINTQSKAPGTMAMETALRDGDVPRILELLSVEDTGYGPNFETSNGATPILVVSEKGSSEDVFFCIERRCSVTHCNRAGVNPLMKAAYHGNNEIIQLLICAGCSLWCRDTEGHDTFRYLHDNEHLDLVRSLLKQNRMTEPPRVTLSRPVEGVRDLRSSLLSSTQKAINQSTSTDQPERDESSGSKDDERISDDTSSDISNDNHDEEAVTELTMRRQWSIRRRALRRDTSRMTVFEAERQKVWRYAERGRRNGLIAPLPHDKAGRLKFPACENCHGNRARKRCKMCDQVLCDKCHARLHELPHRRHHDFEELEPTLMVGTKPLAEVIANQQESLKGALERSLTSLNMIKETIIPFPTAIIQTPTEVEVEKYHRTQRALREKEIAQMQINVPVSAAKHAIKAGEGDIYTNPAEIELADLYITQGKLTKAKMLMEASMQTTEDSLGFSHPTMLKIQTRLARIELHSGDLERGISTIQIALGTFESVVPPDSRDLIVAQDLALQILDSLTDYAAAVELSKRVYRYRVVGLPASHALVEQARKNLDKYVAKREVELMRCEDILVLTQAALSAEQAEKFRAEEERRVNGFRVMLLRQEPPGSYDSYQAFAKKEFAEDMVQFWIAVENAKLIDEQDAKAFRAAVVSIFVSYIKSRRIKIITAVQRKKMKKMITTPGKKIPRTIFDEVEALVFDVIFNRVFHRYETRQRETPR